MLEEQRRAGDPGVDPQEWSENRRAKLVAKGLRLVQEVVLRAFTGEREDIFRSRTQPVRLYIGKGPGVEAFLLPGLKKTHISWSGLDKRRIVVTRDGGLHWVLQSSVDRQSGGDMGIDYKSFNNNDWLWHARDVTAVIEELISVKTDTQAGIRT